MTSDVTWKDFKIEGSGKYKANEPITVSGIFESGLVHNVLLYLKYQNSSGKWEDPKHIQAIPSVKASREYHSNICSFSTQISLNNFYETGKYKIIVKYADVASPKELEFDLVD